MAGRSEPLPGIPDLAGYFVLDAHMHVEGDLPYLLVSGLPEVTGEDLIRDMDAYKIAMAGVMGNPTACAISLQAQARGNDLLARCAKTYPERIFGIGMVNMRAGKASLKEAERCLSGLGMKAIKMWPWADIPINSQPVMDLAAVCEKLDSVLTVHTDNMDPRAHPYLLGEVAKEFPKLQIVMAHMSDRLTLDSIRVAKERSNIALEMSGTVTDIGLRQAVKTISADRVLFGSDWPFFHPLMAAAKILVLPISEKDKAKILGESALKVYGVDRP